MASGSGDRKRKRSGGQRQRLAEATADDGEQVQGERFKKCLNCGSEEHRAAECKATHKQDLKPQEQRPTPKVSQVSQPASSSLVAYLLSEMVWGAISPQQAQHIAHLAKKDIDALQGKPRVYDEIADLAGVGSSGAYPNKCYGDIMRRCIPDIKLPEPFLFKLPYKQPVGEVLQSMMLPHELFSAIFTHYPATWTKSMHPSHEACEHFWTSMEGHPAVTDGLKNRRNFKTHCVPLALHGDGVPLTAIGKGWQQTVTNFSFFSLLGRGNTPDLLFYIFAFFDKLRVLGNDYNATAHRFFLILKWSFTCMWNGKWPSHDFLGRKSHEQHPVFLGSLIPLGFYEFVSYIYICVFGVS